jgi:polygalacturonase
MRLKTLLSVIAGWSFVTAAYALEETVDIRQFGALPDGKTLCTNNIQEAVDKCAAAGGGTVYFPPGKWLSGTIILKSNVTLYLEAGCTWLGSTDIRDYPEFSTKLSSLNDHRVYQSLIAGDDLTNVAIRGRGTIDGQGTHFPWPKHQKRPSLICLVGCRDVLVENVHLRSSAMWMQHYLACERLAVRGITVFNHDTANEDGMDLNGCRDVTVSDCILDTCDDALCFKSTLDRPCENITVSNCILASHCNAIKTGTESNGGFKNITITNCTIRPPRCTECPCFAVRGTWHRGETGIALMLVDGGELSNVTISNITMNAIDDPIFLRLGNRGRPLRKDGPKPGIGTFRNIILSNIVATDARSHGCGITGIPGHCIENITLSNVRLEFAGGGTLQDAKKIISEKESEYPFSGMFGKLPAYGFYFRHVKGLRLNNLQLSVTDPDARSALVYDDVEGCQDPK